jgi:hypothetical protein
MASPAESVKDKRTLANVIIGQHATFAIRTFLRISRRWHFSAAFSTITRLSNY